MGSGKSPTVEIPGSEEAQKMAEEYFNMIKPATQEVTNQTMELLQTGGAQSVNPFIKMMTEAGRSAQSQAMNENTAQLGRSGMLNDSFGQAALTQQNLQGQMALSQIGPQAAMSILPLYTSFLQGQSGLGSQALGQAISGQIGKANAEASNYGTNMGFLSNIFGAATSPFKFGFGG